MIRKPVQKNPLLRAPVVFGGVLILFLFFLGALSATVIRSKNVTRTQASPTTVVERVSRHIWVIPQEQPSVATVQDPDELRYYNPDFYALAKAGDRLLVWSDKAVLYSEEKDLILAVLPIMLNQNATAPVLEQTSATGTPDVAVEHAKIEVRNGTLTPGLARTLTNSLKKEGFDMLTARDAAQRNYERTIIVNASNQPLSVTMQKLAELTGGAVAELPSAEQAARGDILIIIGSDFKQ